MSTGTLTLTLVTVRSSEGKPPSTRWIFRGYMTPPKSWYSVKVASTGMSPVTGCANSPSTFSTRFRSFTVALTLKRPGTAKANVRPWTVDLFAMAALTTPSGVVQSWNCRSTVAIGAGVAVSPTTFQA
jgi:hypothetical protein